MRLISGIVTLVYFLIGVLDANNHDYFTNANGLKGVIAAILAVTLWPLVLLGVNLHLGNTGGGAAALVLLPARWLDASPPAPALASIGTSARAVTHAEGHPSRRVPIGTGLPPHGPRARTM